MTVCSSRELKVKKHFYDVEAKARAKNISVGVENFLYRKRGFYWRRSSFVIMILLAKASHIEKMMVQVQCGQVSRLLPVRIFFSMPINKSLSDRWIFIGRHTMKNMYE